MMASQLQAIYNRVLIRHVATSYEDGKDMLEARNIKGLPYRDFIAWAYDSFGWSEQTINAKINVALRWGEITPTVGVIEDRAIYLLSTKRVPESARQEAKERINAGEEITEEVAKQIRDAHKAKEQAEKEARSAQQQLLALQQEMETLSKPEVIQVDTPETAARLVQLERQCQQ